MPFEEQTLRKTLILQRKGVGDAATFRIHPYFRITTTEGQSYMRPFPSGDISVAHQGLIFNAIEVIEPPGSGQYGGGDTYLTHDTNDCEIRLTANV